MPEEPLPSYELPFTWKNRTTGKVTRTIVEDTCGDVAEAYGENRADCETTAKFIVRACNLHGRLVAAIESRTKVIQDFLEGCDTDIDSPELLAELAAERDTLDALVSEAKQN